MKGAPRRVVRILGEVLRRDSRLLLDGLSVSVLVGVVVEESRGCCCWETTGMFSS
jgi:hypothetical protein